MPAMNYRTKMMVFEDNDRLREELSSLRSQVEACDEMLRQFLACGDDGGHFVRACQAAANLLAGARRSRRREARCVLPRGERDELAKCRVEAAKRQAQAGLKPTAAQDLSVGDLPLWADRGQEELLRGGAVHSLQRR
jgi:hypothetical protein